MQQYSLVSHSINCVKYIASKFVKRDLLKKFVKTNFVKHASWLY